MTDADSRYGSPPTPPPPGIDQEEWDRSWRENWEHLLRGLAGECLPLPDEPQHSGW